MATDIRSAFGVARKSKNADLVIRARAAVEPLPAKVTDNNDAATNLQPEPLARLIPDEVVFKERKRAGVVRRDTRKIDISRKSIQNGKGHVIHPVLDERSIKNFETVERILTEAAGVDPSKTMLVRRAIEVYALYLQNVSTNPEKMLAELRTILRVR